MGHKRSSHRRLLEALESRRLLAQSIYAFPGADGHMLYLPQPLGDHIEDYSNVGYMGGTVPIPDVAVKATVSPVAGDDEANIEAAIATVAPLPLDAVGDVVIVHRPSTQQWIDDLGMNLLTNPWTPGSKDVNMERTITHIDGNVITLDAPLVNALDKKYTDATEGQNTVYEYTVTGRLNNVG